MTIVFIGPLVLAVAGAWGKKDSGENKVAITESALGFPWSLVINSAVLYALAYNLTFFLQELFLVIPKAIYGLQPTLYHNNHNWRVSDPFADLLQGSGALAILISALVFLGILSRLRQSQSLIKLFSIWMVYQGFAQSLPQFAGLVLNPDGDVADALNYLNVGETLGYGMAIAAFGLLVVVGLSLTKPLLELAPSSAHVATARSRTNFILQIATLSALIGVILIIPFRVPPIEQIEGPILGFLFPLFWTAANSWRANNVQPTDNTANQQVNWIPIALLIGLLAIFQLLLAPGVSFFYAN